MDSPGVEPLLGRRWLDHGDTVVRLLLPVSLRAVTKERQEGEESLLVRAGGQAGGGRHLAEENIISRPGSTADPVIL